MVVVPEGENNLQSFDELVELFPRLRGYVLRELRAAYEENPAGFAYVAREALLEGRKPAALLVWRVRHGEYRLALDGLSSHHHHHLRAIVDECMHGCGRTVCIDDGELVLCLECRRQSGYEDAA